MAADLVHQKVAVLISTGGEPAIRAAMKSTTTIPIVFTLGGDPVERACRQFNPPAAT
jgi:putative ABC transport system substrate-binding protein